MSEWTLEKAREIAAEHPNPFTSSGGRMHEYYEAVGYLEGYASRDQEVEKLKADLKEARMQCGNNAIQASGYFAELLEKREASRKLVTAARKVEWHPHLTTCPCRDDWRKDCTCGKEDLEEALKPYIDATPGHSPEGKTL